VNWKPTLIAAVIVVALGLGAGVAIGGKTTTNVKTVAGAAKTVVQTVTVPGASMAAVTPGEEGTPTVTTEGTATEGDPVYLTADDIHVQDSVYLTEAGVSASLQRGAELSDSVVLDLDDTYDGNPDSWSVEIPIPVGKSRFKTTMGFEKGSPSDNSVTVEFRKDSLRGEIIKRVPLSATQVADVDIPVSPDGGLLVVKFVPGEKSWQRSDDLPLFVLGEARFA
jgi:hypothetical protein